MSNWDEVKIITWNCGVGYSIVCYECGKLLRNAQGQDIENIHSNSDGEDVCESCCDVCGNGTCDVCDMPLSKSEAALNEAV